MYDELNKAVADLKRLSDFYMPYIKNKEDEADLAIFKQRTVIVDGYEIQLYFHKEHHAHFNADEEGDNQEYDILTLQVYSIHFPFLPFNLLCKIARKFLGDRNLALSEYLLMGRKVYVWNSVRSGDGSTIPLNANTNILWYEGLEYAMAPAGNAVMIP